MRNYIAFLAVVGLAGCDMSHDPVVVEEAPDFPVRAEWSATVAPVRSTVTGAANLTEYVGSQVDAEASLSGGLPNRAYQWRVFRGSCAATDADDLALFSTIQAYPNLTTDASGKATVTRFMAGALDSTANYSVRFRVATSSTNWNGTNPIACGDLQRS